MLHRTPALTHSHAAYRVCITAIRRYLRFDPLPQAIVFSFSEPLTIFIISGFMVSINWKAIGLYKGSQNEALL